MFKTGEKPLWTKGCGKEELILVPLKILPIKQSFWFHLQPRVSIVSIREFSFLQIFVLFTYAQDICSPSLQGALHWVCATAIPLYYWQFICQSQAEAPFCSASFCFAYPAELLTALPAKCQALSFCLWLAFLSIYLVKGLPGHLLRLLLLLLLLIQFLFLPRAIA